MAKRSKTGPRAGVDYPRDLIEFDEFFPTEESCRHYLEQVRWGDGFVCRTCGRDDEPWRIRRDVRLCRHCRSETTLTAGTIFAGTRKPLRLWFRAMWEVTSQKYGANALGLQRVLGVGSYKTAWAWLHKLRRAMVRPNRDRLHGCVEVDESYVGGPEAGVRGRETVNKAIVAIAVEIGSANPMGRVRLRHVPDVSAPSLVGFVTDVIDPGTAIHTDGWPSYGSLNSLGFAHSITVQSASKEPAHVLMPAAHRVASLLKRWLLGTLQGGISVQHLPYYLDEFTFRFNRRTCRARGMLFIDSYNKPFRPTMSRRRPCSNIPDADRVKLQVV